MRRIVFSTFFFRQALPVQLVFTSTKSRRKFCTQVERQSFHSASTRSGRTAKPAWQSASRLAAEFLVEPQFAAR
jgi:hypothetical protein